MSAGISDISVPRPDKSMSKGQLIGTCCCFIGIILLIMLII